MDTLAGDRPTTRGDTVGGAADDSTVGFDDFVLARSTSLLRTAYLLTRDHALAEDLLQTALTKAWFAWPRIETNPETYVRKILVNTFASWWRRKWNGEHSHGDLPEPDPSHPRRDEHAGADQRHDLWEAMGRLPRKQRAVVVLRFVEDHQHPDEHVDQPGGPLVSTLHDLRETLERHAEGLEYTGRHDRATAVRRRARAVRRRRTAATAVAAIVVVGGVAGVATFQAPREPEAADNTVVGVAVPEEIAILGFPYELAEGAVLDGGDGLQLGSSEEARAISLVANRLGSGSATPLPRRHRRGQGLRR